MKILQINCVYGKGSTGKITRDIHRGLLEAGHASVVICGRGAVPAEPGVHKLCTDWYARANKLRSMADGLMYGGCFFSTNAIIAKIRREKPDVVHLQCINGYFVNLFRLLKFLKNSGIPTVMTLHAEFMYTANCGHAGQCSQWIEGCSRCPALRKQTKSLFFDRTGYSWKLFHRQYRDWDRLTAVGCSEWISGRARQAGALRDRRIVTIRNGVDNTTVFYPRAGAGDALRSRYCIPADRKIVLYVAPAFTREKGYDLVLQLAQKAENLPFHFLLVGQTAASEMANVTVAGPVYSGEELALLYSGADALLMCSRFETYPTVCLEAVSCGTPVAGFDVGGVAETIPEGMGGVVEPGAMEAMLALLTRLTARRPDAQAIQQARAIHSRTHMVSQYLALYQSLLQGVPENESES